MTSIGTSHPSCTDAPLIEPLLLSWTTGASIDVKEGVKQYVDTSVEFIQYLRSGKREGLLDEEVTHPEYDEDVRGEERKKEMGRMGEMWQIHVAPERGRQRRVG